MSIANELSSEVAVWLLASHSLPMTANTASVKDLGRIILELHTTLQRLKDQERTARRNAARLPVNLKTNTAGNH